MKKIWLIIILSGIIFLGMLGSLQISEKVKQERKYSSIFIPSHLKPIEVLKKVYSDCPQILALLIALGGELQRGIKTPEHFSVWRTKEGFATILFDSKDPQFQETYYLTKKGTKIKSLFAEDPEMRLDIIIEIRILKYENTRLAFEVYQDKSKAGNFKETLIEGVKLKTKEGLSSASLFSNTFSKEALEAFLEESKKEMGWSETQFKKYLKGYEENSVQYLLYSNNWIIYITGLKEAAKDGVERIINCYGINNSNYMKKIHQ